MNKAYVLLGLLLRYANTGGQQEKVTEIYNRMRADGLTEREIELQLVQALHDGLAYGNWIWDM